MLLLRKKNARGSWLPVVCFNWSTCTSTVPEENFPTSQRKAPDGNKDVWKCRSSRQGKYFLTCIKCTTDFLSNLHDPLTKFPGVDHFYRKSGSWGTIFPLKMSVQGTKIFRTKISVTVHATSPEGLQDK